MKRIIVILSFAIFCCAGAFAAGVPDSSFSFNGKAFAGFGRGNDSAEKSALCADGSMIVLGRAGRGVSYSYALVKFTPQGAADASFGNDGVVDLNLASFNIPSLYSEAVDLAVGPDCSAYVAGGHGPDMSVGKYSPSGALVQVFDGGETGFLLNGVIQALTIQPDGSVLAVGNQGNEYRDYAVYRYLPSGALDINFGNGGRSYAHMGWKGRPTSIRVESGGKIVVTGSIIPDGSPTPAITQALIARYNFDGSLDGSFNGSGVYVGPARNGRSEVFQKSFTLADGRTLAAGTSSLPDIFNPKKYVFSRFMPNGKPDSFFGSRGTIISTLGTDDRSYIFEYQNNGSLFVGNERAKIYKFDINAGLDLSYGTQGSVALEPYVGVNSLTSSPDGKLVVGGVLFGNRPAPVGNTSDNDMAVLSLNSDGSPDTGFNGVGKASRDIGDNVSLISDVALQADGKIVVAGGLTSYPGSGGFFYGTGVSRYNPDGTPDMTFGDNGKVYLSSSDPRATTSVLGVAAQPDGKILAAGLIGSSGGSNSSGIRVTRFNGDGSLDASFGSGGIFTYMQQGFNAFDIALQPDGKIVVGGFNSNYDFMLMRLTPDGALDPELGGTGIVTTDINSYDTGATMVIQPNGKIILAGASGMYYTDFSMVRFNSNGTLDQTFGRRGKVITNMGAGVESSISSVALTPDGNIVAAGYRRAQTTSGIVVARYTGKGMLDSSFASGGIFKPDAGFESYYFAQSAQVANDGSVFITGGFISNIRILKLTPAGVPDETWAPGGFLNTGIYSGGGYGPDSLLDTEGRLVVSGVGNSGSGFIARFASMP